ncbi:MAG: acetylxylan esterase [Bacteroidales bacterium]|nr:acetylxylan esterase [Bacteroidales bacterium]
MNFRKTLLSVGLALVGVAAFAQTPRYADSDINFEKYFKPATETPASPDAQGFIRRWLMLDPISKPNRGNTVFIDSYIRDAFAREYYKGQFASMSDLALLPKDGQKIKKVVVDAQKPVDLSAGRPMFMAEPELIQEKVTLTWHALDSNFPNVKLFRFATGQGLTRYGVIFNVVTVINCDEDIENVRLATGSNSASMWWVNGEEAVIMSGDRRMVQDDCASARLTLHKGKNILRGAIINGPGMSDMIVRFIDEAGNPVKNFTVTTK